jgi:ferredoxin
VIPPVAGYFRRRAIGPPLRPWPDAAISPPPELLSQPGIRRVPAEEARAFAENPLHDWGLLHADTREQIFRNGWPHFVPMAPRLARAGRYTAKVVRRDRDRAALHADDDVDTTELTAALKARAAELGIGACGVAPYNEKYTFAEWRDHRVGDRVVVCALEVNWAAVQTSPGSHAEKAHLMANTALQKRMAQLAEFLQDRGYRACPENISGTGVVLHYAVEAGLGQLGLNGQLLTPHAGSRCRIMMLNTNAPLNLDHPVDFGVTKLCDSCQVCVRRCPSGAIPNRRQVHRGVEKIKIIGERCAPVVARVQGCAVCMRVCPVQRYGLPAVLEEFERSGQILGKGTDELEAYVFEGQRYPAGRRPKLSAAWLKSVPYDALPTPPTNATRDHSHL